MDTIVGVMGFAFHFFCFFLFCSNPFKELIECKLPYAWIELENGVINEVKLLKYKVEKFGYIVSLDTC